MNVAACCCLLRVLCCIAQLDFVPLYANNYVKACENVLVLAGCLDALVPKRLVLFRLIMHAMYLFFGKLLNAQREREKRLNLWNLYYLALGRPTWAVDFHS